MKKIGALGCLGIGLGGLIVMAIISYVVFGGFYNKAISLNEEVSGQWANVESSYQRRNDLIPNIVATAKKYAEFEQETLIGVIEARAAATSVKVDASKLTADQIQKFAAVQGKVSTGLGRLLATYENYPNLKANENFKELINELSRTENRINVERNRFNGSVKGYNIHVKKFPGSLLSGVFGFTETPYFKADEGAEKAPDVDNLFGAN
ncbi:MAG: LemA family protein [Nonlabens sp.]|jgi:LemA protein|uniref:LemA family protein n=1 Tax=Nonlabens sp. TaxID=1888209 RepID=UPI0035A5AD7C